MVAFAKMAKMSSCNKDFIVCKNKKFTIITFTEKNGRPLDLEKQ